MWLLEKLFKELFENSVEYALGDVIRDESMLVLGVVAIFIWTITTVYQIIKGVCKAIKESLWKYKYSKELKKLKNISFTKKRSK